MELTAMKGYVVVQPPPKSKETKGGIILPDSAGQRMQATGKVISTGTKYVEVGQNIIFSPHGAEYLEIEGEVYYVVHKDKVQAILLD